MKNLHKNPTAYLAFAGGLFTVLVGFAQQHCTVRPEDLMALAIGVSTFIGGYLRGKGTPTA